MLVDGRGVSRNVKPRRILSFSMPGTKFVVPTEYMSGAVLPLALWVCMSIRIVMLYTFGFFFMFSTIFETIAYVSICCAL